jgi:hypothetical protein
MGLTLLAKLAGAAVYIYVTIPATYNIQTELYSTFPTGTFTANNALATVQHPRRHGKLGAFRSVAMQLL